MAVKSEPLNFAFALQACGYSTDANYGNKLMQIVQQFDLTQYDVAGAGPFPPASNQEPAPAHPGSFTPKASAKSSVVKEKPAAPAKVKP
jgi:hypothetical protein